MTTQTATPFDAMATEDLQRLVEFAQLITAGRDAMSDEIVTRLAGALSEGLTLLDRLTRNEGLMHLLKVLDRQETQYLLVALSDAIHAASQDIPATPPATGGLGCLLRVVRDPGTQEGLRLLSVFGKHMSHSMREQHRQGG
ncbi:MAG: helical membrane plugin domain-containing protein [Thiobacillus sp.]